MSNLRLKLPNARATSFTTERLPLGQILIESGKISRKDLLHGLALQRRVDVPLGEVLAAEGLVSRSDILEALGQQYNAQAVDLSRDPSDPRLRDRLPSSLCLQFSAIPWLEIGDRLLVATARPDRFARLCAFMGEAGSRMLPVIVDHKQVQTEICRLYGNELAQKAATRVPAAQSCRSWEINTTRRAFCACAIIVATLLLLCLAPAAILSALLIYAVATLLMTTVLKASALYQMLPKSISSARRLHLSNPHDFRLPQVSVLVPLLHEKEIAGALVARLSKLTYPKSLLQVLLVLEAGDKVTRRTIENTSLPDWMDVIEVPEIDNLRTKPRALNYALDFCKGSIVGVWDAEDAPEPDQIEKIVSRFDQAPENVACLQGVLDYYNSRNNWMARCFAIEYATWWRVLLPGVARLGLVVPLGGTTLFFRRAILERLCGWDAHNVTEDADLGLRLARHHI